MRYADVDWERWAPQDVATLMFVVRPGGGRGQPGSAAPSAGGGQVLLIRKLRGLGKGKINAPGGRTEPGETLVAAAVRETEEEVGVTPLAPRHRGELRFQFVDGYRLECHVFTADGCEGEARATDEAIPLWVSLAAIPYDEMWADDRLWLPLVLAGRTPFRGHFIFDGDTMGEHTLTAHDPAEALFARLDALGVRHDTHAHAPVFTVPQAKAVRVGAASSGTRAARHTKNLFVRNKKGRMWLVTLDEDRVVDLDALAATLGAGNLSFASPERLRKHLGVEPGSVTPLAVMNDATGEVGFVLDGSFADDDLVACHPLTNDRTTLLSGADLVRFAVATGHTPLRLPRLEGS